MHCNHAVWTLALLACAACGGGGQAPPVHPLGDPAGGAPSASASPSASAESDAEADSDAEGREPLAPELPENVFLSMLPTVARDRALRWVQEAPNSEAFARALRVRLEVMRAYKDAGELTRRSGLGTINGTFQITDLTRLQSRDRALPAHRKRSFVVDFDEPSLAAPVQLLTQHHAQPSALQIAHFVGQYIDDKNYSRGFDIASRVAATRSGDCTEHAVLTVALLRHFGFAARLVFGLVVVGVGQAEQPRLMAVGHAWAEYHASQRWHLVDAALQPSDSEQVVGAPGLDKTPKLLLAYLPIVVMKDESASYSRALMDEVGVESIVRVEIDAPAAP